MILVNEENEEKFSFDKYILSSYQGSTVLIEAIKLVNFSAQFISNLSIVLRVRVILSARDTCMHVVIVKSIKSIRPQIVHSFELTVVISRFEKLKFSSPICWTIASYYILVNLAHARQRNEASISIIHRTVLARFSPLIANQYFATSGESNEPSIFVDSLESRTSSR